MNRKGMTFISLPKQRSDYLYTLSLHRKDGYINAT